MLGLTRRELETCLREPDCGPERKRRRIHRTLSAARQFSTLPESGGEETCPRESACGPVAKAPDKPPAPYRQRASSRLYYRFANFARARPHFR